MGWCHSEPLPIFCIKEAQIWTEGRQTLFFGFPKSLQMVTAVMTLKDACSLKEKLWPTYSILKSRDITLPTKVCLVKAMVFPVVMYGHESWTKESWVPKNWCVWTWCWRRFLRVSWTARRPNQSILKEISPGCSLEGLMWSWNSNTLVTWCQEWTHWKRPWCWKRLKGGEGDDRG